MEITLGSEVRFLRGVGEQRMKKYQKLGITTVEELLRHLPRDYTDLRRAVSIGAAAPSLTGNIRWQPSGRGKNTFFTAGWMEV